MTFSIDAYKGWNVGRLKNRCRELVRAVMRQELIIAMLVEYGADWQTKMPPEFVEDAKRINAARRDDDADTPPQDAGR